MVAPMMMVLEVLQNLLSNGQFDSVAVELEKDNFLIIKHTLGESTHERGIDLGILSDYLPARDAELVAWALEVNNWAEASLIRQEMPKGTTIH